MAATRSALSSPISPQDPSLHGYTNGNGQRDGEMGEADEGDFPLQFLSFMNQELGGSPINLQHESGVPEAVAGPGPSTLNNLNLNGLNGDIASTPETSSHSPATSTSRAKPKRTTGRRQSKRVSQTPTKQALSKEEGEMDVDGNEGELNDQMTNGIAPLRPSQLMGMPSAVAEGRGMELGMAELYQPGNGEFDAAQAGLLQQQLEHIHMQSPAMFTNGQSGYNALAPMYLPQQGEVENGFSSVNGGNEMHKWPEMTSSGVLTPGPSGDLYPESRSDHVPPVHLDHSGRSDHDGQYPVSAPLLSPALSNHIGSSSNYTSPIGSFPSVPRKSPLEELQEQQRHFQHQLYILQNQQRQLEATAAAVASSSGASPYAQSHTSPYFDSTQSSHSGPSGPSRPGGQGTHTPGEIITGPVSAGPMSSPGFFSPLTSPALDSGPRSHYFQHAQTQPRNPLSNLSSPALNPVGSSGGAQQTLSPALEPQKNEDMDYLSNLVGYLDSQGLTSQPESMTTSNSQYHSPAVSTSSHAHSSPLVAPINGGGTGPHRHSLPLKSRPSPMIKPTHRGRPSTHGSGSVPSSPIASKMPHHGMMNGHIPGMGFLPPAAIHPSQTMGHIQQHYMPLGGSGSISSETPSPVDLAQIMPPPPMPDPGRMRGGPAPLTPASLMNLGHGIANGHQGEDGQPMSHDPMMPPNSGNNGATTQATIAQRRSDRRLSGAHTTAAKRGTTAKNTSASKRALAMRPSQGSSLRAAAAKASAAASYPQEDATKKTSHKAAEQKRRDSLKAGFDELRMLLPPINTEALDPESGEPIPGSSAPRLLPKSSLVPDDNPNRGVSKVALLKFGNEYIVRLHEKVDKRDGYIDKLRDEIRRLRLGESDEVRGDEGEDLLDMDMLIGEEEEEEESGGTEGGEGQDGEGEGMDEDDDLDDGDDEPYLPSRRRLSLLERRPSLGKKGTSSASGDTVTLKSSRRG